MTEKTKLDIALLLPAVPDARDACVRRLGDILTAKKGIDTAHLVDTSLNGVNQICIHFDPDQLSIGEVRELAIRAGAELDQQFGHLLLNSQTMYARQASSFEARAKEIPGILDAAVSPTGLLKIEFDRKVTNEESIRAALRKIGVSLTDAPVMADDLSHLPFAVGLSRQTSRIIRQNLWFSLGMVAFLVPATILGLQLGAAVVFHEGSTLLVVFNALRLLSYRST